MDFLELTQVIEGAMAEVPEAVGKALKYMGDEITRLGTKLEELAAKMEAK
jgi:hypothetical protein